MKFGELVPATFIKNGNRFTAELRRVGAAGVEVHAYSCAVSTEEVVIAEEIGVRLVM